MPLPVVSYATRESTEVSVNHNDNSLDESLNIIQAENPQIYEYISKCNYISGGDLFTVASLCGLYELLRRQAEADDLDKELI